MNQQEHSINFSERTHIKVWLSLIVLTALTVTITTLRLGSFSLLAAVFIALIKGSLVVLFFMNIAKEPLIFRVMLGAALGVLAVILVLTFVDVLFR